MGKIYFNYKHKKYKIIFMSDSSCMLIDIYADICRFIRYNKKAKFIDVIKSNVVTS